jgi:hypothetical protein
MSREVISRLIASGRFNRIYAGDKYVITIDESRGEWLWSANILNELGEQIAVDYNAGEVFRNASKVSGDEEESIELIVDSVLNKCLNIKGSEHKILFDFIRYSEVFINKKGIYIGADRKGEEHVEKGVLASSLYEANETGRATLLNGYAEHIELGNEYILYDDERKSYEFAIDGGEYHTVNRGNRTTGVDIPFREIKIPKNREGLEVYVNALGETAHKIQMKRLRW